MGHNHKHSCVCEHESVKYCKHCRTVYCLDCNQEWQQNYWYNGITTYTYPNTQLGNTTGGLGSNILANNQASISCTHGG